jgi:hypothetical protein
MGREDAGPASGVKARNAAGLSPVSAAGADLF